MKPRCITALLFGFLFLFVTAGKAQDKSKPSKTISQVPVQWVDSFSGDFSFAGQWSYTEGIRKDAGGQFICTGPCPLRYYSMVDGTGHVLRDSLRAFYQIADTARYFHTLRSTVQAYEYEGSNFIDCFRNASGFVNCYTQNNSATRSSLRLSIGEGICRPLLQLNSAVPGVGIKLFKCTQGKILIDQKMWDKGYLKAEFEFQFLNTLDPGKPLSWKGKILAPLQEF